MIKDNLIFLREGLCRLKDTGALFPTSRYAAQAMVAPLRERNGIQRPLRILEVGPGTGSVSLRVIEQMRVGDELTVCEINPSLMKILKEKLAEHPFYSRHSSRIHYFCGPVQELAEDCVFDVIVCSLPFLNFDLTTIGEIFTKFRQVSHSETLMTYYEYLGIRAMSVAVAPPARRRRMRELDVFLDRMLQTHKVRGTKVWANLSPITVYQLRDIDRLALPEECIEAVNQAANQ